MRVIAARVPEGSAARRPLVLTGGPAVGKSVTGRALADARPRAAFIDVDDVRQLVVAGGVPPWRGAEGSAQQALGVLNAASMARRFRDAGFDVVVVDVVTPRTALLYRRELAGCVLVHLVATFEEATRRAATRPSWLTSEELRALHDRDRASPPAVDHRLEVTAMTLDQQVAAAEAIWATA